jgi:dipeptidyl-peptidase-4
MRVIILSLCLTVYIPSTGAAQEEAALTLSDIYDSDKFTEESLEHARWIPDTEAFTFLRTDKIDSVASIYRFDAESKSESLLVDGHILYLRGTDILLQIESYEWSEDGTKILIATDTEDIWRNSKTGKYYICDMADMSLHSVFDTSEVISNAKFSPDGTMVGYVFDNNVCTTTLTRGTTSQLTEDGSDVIINGQFDWVYEEEFWMTDGWHWSPDSKKIAFWRLDQSAEPEFSLIDYEPLHQDVTSFRYPKAGDANASVKIGVIHLDKDEIVWMDLGEETDIYVPRIKWTDDSDVLSIQKLNRHQNKLDLLLADVNTGETKSVLTETDSCWVDVHDNLVFLENAEQFLWTSERSGYNHIYLYQNDGALIRQVTEGKWEVRSVYGADEEGIVYFSSNQENVTERHIYGIRLDGGGLADS